MGKAVIAARSILECAGVCCALLMRSFKVAILNLKSVIFSESLGKWQNRRRAFTFFGFGDSALGECQVEVLTQPPQTQKESDLKKKNRLIGKDVVRTLQASRPA